MNKPRVLVLTGFGLNCDYETAHAFELAGASAQRVHINSLIKGEVALNDFQIMVFIGGFSWGDDHGAGVLQALRLKTHVGDKIQAFVQEGKLILGICNGFQTLVNMGLLPGIGGDYKKRSVAITHNDCGNFRDDWVALRVNANSECVFTRGMTQMELPIRHGEGKFVAVKETLDVLRKQNQIVVQYTRPEGDLAHGAFPYNPNGSLDDIAGICDETGRIFGLMPHPEADHHVTHHPDWTRKREIMKRSGQPWGIDLPQTMQLFENAVTFIREEL